MARVPEQDGQGECPHELPEYHRVSKQAKHGTRSLCALTRTSAPFGLSFSSRDQRGSSAPPPQSSSRNPRSAILVAPQMKKPLAILLAFAATLAAAEKII